MAKDKKKQKKEAKKETMKMAEELQKKSTDTYYAKNNSMITTTEPLVSFHAAQVGPKCPFGNKYIEFHMYSGGCVWLRGNSGVGKTTLSSYLAGLSSKSNLKNLDIECKRCEWKSSIPPSERCGVLFQQTTLIDELTVAGNICLALNSCPSQKFAGDDSDEKRDAEIQQIMEMVGLHYARDCNKRPTQLSGGMARRASLAVQLAQRKRCIVLDEPFTGLDYNAAKSVAAKLLQLRQTRGTSFLLISHEPHLANLVLHGKEEEEVKKGKQKENGGTSSSAAANTNVMKHNYTITMHPQKDEEATNTTDDSSRIKLNLFGITVSNRFLAKLLDYIGWSFPLIALTFMACGLAIAMLSADILQRVDITEHVLDIVDEYVRPLINLVTGSEETNPMYLMIVKMKIKSMMNTVLPEAKAKLYAIGIAKLFVLEIGPLLTALLLCGRIGGSYAGKVATMEATAQNKLLQTIGLHPQYYTLLPAIMAALIASPILTIIGTAIAIVCGGIVGPNYYGGITTLEDYTQDVYDSTFPELRLRNVRSIFPTTSDDDSGNSLLSSIASSVATDDSGAAAAASGEETSSLVSSTMEVVSRMSQLPMQELVDCRTLHTTTTEEGDYPWWKDTLIEITTYPPIFLLLKSTTYIVIILLVAECSARIRRNLSPRGVPTVITSSVVIASLLVIVADWGFSQWLIKRY